MGTQIGFNLTPEKFFMARTILAMYNLALLFAVWYKLRQARREKLELEMSFFGRVDAVMSRMARVFGENEYIMN